jgi:HSP20 family protein
MALSEFPRLGFDPFVELRRMQSDEPAVLRVYPNDPRLSTDQYLARREQRGVTSELPGVTQGDVTINLQEDVLTLERARRPKQEQDVNWQRRERAHGSFSRTVQLPFRVDSDKVQAQFNNGILEIELQRLEADRPKKIQIRAG